VAVKIITVRSCDLHRGDEVDAVETVRLGRDGTWYEIDLCEAHRAEVTTTVEGWVERVRRVAPVEDRLERLRAITGESGPRNRP
jgi:hypothetical protein